MSSGPTLTKEDAQMYYANDQSHRLVSKGHQVMAMAVVAAGWLGYPTHARAEHVGPTWLTTTPRRKSPEP